MSAFQSDVAKNYADYLQDESRQTGQAASLSFPATEEEVRAHVRESARLGLSLTVQGGRTGITAGAVPDGGHILNLSRMNRLRAIRHDDNGWRLTAQPGALLTDVRQALAARKMDTADDPATAQRTLAGAPPLFLATDPTETSASLGGMAACNASGARSYQYGAMRRYVERLRVVMDDGDALELRRGREKAQGRLFELTTLDGRIIRGTLPGYTMPDVKNAAGYFAADNMDLIDLFIGSEGTLGIITEMDVRLLPLPPVMWGLTAFFPGESAALSFVGTMRHAAIAPAALEFFDHAVLDLLRQRKAELGAGSLLPALNPAWHTAVYVEFLADRDEDAEEAVNAATDAIIACGGDPEQAWLACDAQELEKQKQFRHAVPESVNQTIAERKKTHPGLTKLGTDLAVPDPLLPDVMALYRRGIEQAGLEAVMFGHIGNNHLHVNILPRNPEEYRRGKALYLGWAGWVADHGGSVSAEHGIGKLKRDMLLRMYGENGVAQMRALKHLFDPAGRLSPGNLFTA
jgi:D-lactate dehydrogenase (cytochrome)